MPTFPLWDKETRAVSTTETVTIDRSEIKSMNDENVRDSNDVVRSLTEVWMKDGTKHLIGLPAGEVHDRLNDDYATAPDMGDGGLLSGLGAASSEPAVEPLTGAPVREEDDDDD